MSAQDFAPARKPKGTAGKERLSAAHLLAGADPALMSTGQPLDGTVRARLEPRFGHDFSRVRVHTDDRDALSARALGAKAYTVGHDIVFAPGRFAPGTLAGERLLVHELAHVVQGGTASRPEGIGGPDHPLERQAAQLTRDAVSSSTPLHVSTGQSAPSMVWRDADPTAAAVYPSVEERARIQQTLNPQQQHAAETGTSVAPVTDPDGFRDAMLARLSPHIDRVLAAAQRIQSAGTVLGMPETQALGDIAQHEVNQVYATYLTAAVHSPVEQAARASYRLREHLHEVPSSPTPQTDATAHDWVASRMRLLGHDTDYGADLFDDYHVLAGEGARDQPLFESVRDYIFNNRAADLRTIILYFPGYEGGGEAYIQRRIPAAASAETPDETRARGRWSTLGTTIHEMLHAVAHEDFRSGVENLEASGIAVEGFAEHFTRPVYRGLVERAQGNDALRASIEGGPASGTEPPERTGYQPYVDAVVHLRDILGGNEENLRVAFFMGRVEYLGLGGWTESEAIRRRAPANSLGAAALLTNNGQGYFRAQYTGILLGRGGPLQLNVGGIVGYLTQDQRLSLGGSAFLQYSWPNLYVRGGLDIAAGASLTQPFGGSVRLDLIPGIEAGARIGVMRVGVAGFLIVPVAGGPISDRTVRLAVGLGLSATF